jgi:hypothetical protein
MVIDDEVFKIDLLLFDFYCNKPYLDDDAKKTEEQRVLDEVKKIMANYALAAVYSEEVRREAENILDQASVANTENHSDSESDCDRGRCSCCCRGGY